MEALVIAAAWGIIIAIFSLAAAVIIMSQQAGKQSKILSDQFKIQRSQLIPYISIGGLRIEGDDIIVDITNNSGVGAYWLGLKARFHIVYPRYYGSKEDRQELDADQVKKYETEGKIVYVKYFLIPDIMLKGLVYDKDIVVPKGIINFTFDIPTAVLLPQTHALAKFHPLFGINAVKGNWRKALDYAELREFLINNNIPCAAISLDVVYKDIAETPVGAETVDAFVCIVNVHSNLQAAWEKHYSIDFIGLSRGEILTKLKYVDEDWYNNTWSSWNLSGPLDRL